MEAMLVWQLGSLCFNDSCSCLVISYVFYMLEVSVTADVQGIINVPRQKNQQHQTTAKQIQSNF